MPGTQNKQENKQTSKTTPNPKKATVDMGRGKSFIKKKRSTLAQWKPSKKQQHTEESIPTAPSNISEPVPENGETPDSEEEGTCLALFVLFVCRVLKNDANKNPHL